MKILVLVNFALSSTRFDRQSRDSTRPDAASSQLTTLIGHLKIALKNNGPLTTDTSR